MKRVFCIASCAILLLAFACAPAANAGPSAAPEATAAATATAEPTPEPTPEPLGLAPMDLLGKGYNPFFNEVFPAGYTVFGAQYFSADAHTGAKDTYLLDLTAQGNPEDIATTCAGILGVADEAQLSTYAAALEKDGFVVIEGTYAGSPASVVMKKTSAGVDFDQCTEVDGCRVEFAVEIDAAAAKNASAMVLANYSTAALGGLATQMGDDTIHMDQLSIFVNTQRPEKTTVTVFHTVKDAAALLSSARETLQTNWFDEAYSSFGLQYGMQNLTYTFNKDNNVVQASLSPNDNSTPAGQFKLEAKSLTMQGFQYDQKAMFCIYEDKGQNIQFVISRPDMGDAQLDWNIQYLQMKSDYLIGIWYSEKDKQFIIQADKDGVDIGCHFDPATGSTDGGWPDSDTVTSILQKAYGVTDENIRAMIIQDFEKSVQDRFGMTWQELYALPVW
jgi:hypothetical protein